MGRKVFEKDAVIEHDQKCVGIPVSFHKESLVQKDRDRKETGSSLRWKTKQNTPTKKQTNPYQPNKQTKSFYCIVLMIQLHNQYIFEITQL